MNGNTVSNLTALSFIIKFLLVDMVHFGSWIVFAAVLTIGFVLCLAAFGTFSVADIKFAGCFSVFAHDKILPMPVGITFWPDKMRCTRFSLIIKYSIDGREKH